MKIQRNTIVLVLIAASLGCVVLYTESRRAFEAENIASQAQQRLFDFEERQIQTLAVETSSQSLQFERNSEGTWQMNSPESGPASEASIAFLLNLLVTARPVDSAAADGLLPITTEQQADFGFEPPLAEIQLGLEDGTQHVIILGGADFSGQSTYAQLDPESTEELEVVLLSGNFESAVNRSLKDWQYQEAEVEAAEQEADDAQEDSPEAEEQDEQAAEDAQEESPVELPDEPEALSEEADQGDEPQDNPEPE